MTSEEEGGGEVAYPSGSQESPVDEHFVYPLTRRGFYREDPRFLALVQSHQIIVVLCPTKPIIN